MGFRREVVHMKNAKVSQISVIRLKMEKECGWDSKGIRIEMDLRMAFFMHNLDLRLPLATPAGDLRLPDETPKPERLKFLKYEKPC